VTEDLEFLVEGRRRFQGDRFEALYTAWRSGRINELGVRAEFNRVTPDRIAFFETHVVNGHHSPSGVDGRKGDGCVKDTHHLIRPASRHRGADAKLLGA